MTEPLNQPLAILTAMLEGMLNQLQGQPLVITKDNIEAFATGLINMLDFHGWSLAYDEEKTRANIEAITQQFSKRMRSQSMDTPVRPPERLDG